MTVYIPKIICGKCNISVIPQRVHVLKTNRRFLVAECHGVKQEMDFVTEPNQEVVFDRPLDSYSPSPENSIATSPTASPLQAIHA